MDPVRLQPSSFTSVTCSVPVSSLWAVAADPLVLPDLSTELQEVRVISPDPIGLGTVVEGDQLRGERRWTTTSTVTAYDTGRLFEWTVGDLATPVSRWSFLLDTHSAGTTLTHKVDLLGGPSPLSERIAAEPARAEDVIHERLAVLRERMAVTLRGLVALVQEAL